MRTYPTTLTSFPFLLILLLLTLLTTTTLAAPAALPLPAADAKDNPNPIVEAVPAPGSASSAEVRAIPDGATHFARSVPEIIAEKSRRQKRDELVRGKEKGRMGLW